ncbi:MAG TPA: hypothetical protein VJ853_15415 [Thermoanaerobaculia bacterium]|nr:hypothetical protein [Thermoanaerobaculia bacterium]
MAEEILRVQSLRAIRARRMQIGQHLIAAILLINAGMERGMKSPLAIAEMVAGALLIATVIRDRFRRGQHGHVAWVELAGALMTLVESIERTRGRHHTSFIILSYFAPAILFAFAIFDAQIAERRYLKADDDGFEMRLRLFFRRRVRWKDARSFRVAGTTIEVEGAKPIQFRDVIDRDRAIEWSVAQFRRHGVAEST